MLNYSNPALVIGIGGTGQWVLTHIKNNLLERFEKIPPQIRLLAFDTTSEDSEVYKRETKEPIEDEVKVGPVRLIPGEEFIYLRGNIKNTCEQIKEGKFAHIGSWLQAEDYLRTLSDDDFNLSRGAGQRRQFGRMGLFLDLMSINNNKVIGKISDALQGIVSVQTKAQAIDIYVVTSVAGGTGSGMFIDIAHLVRQIAQRNIRAEVTVRGFIALHNTFHSVIRVEQVKPQAYAAIRELNRFITMFGEEYPINYSENPNFRELRTVYTSKLFDNCFLLDAERSQLSLRERKPQYGVYPSIADCITMLMDPSSGDTFQQHYKNVNNRVVDIQKRKPFAMYSSMGTLSFILPVEDMIKASTLRFSNEFLETYFKYHPETKDAHDKLAADVQIFMQQAASNSGIQNTAFVQHVALITARTNIEDEASIQQISSQGNKMVELFEPSGEDAETKNKKSRLYGLCTPLLINDVQPSKLYGDTYESALVRIPQQINTLKGKYLGEINPDTGKRRQGELHKLLDEIQLGNIKRFQDILQEHILGILNDANASNHRSRLGYATDYLLEIGKCFDKFVTVIERARAQRDGEAQIVYAREDARRALERLESSTKNRNFLDTVRRKLSSKSEEDFAQEDYINSEQYILDLEIEDILFTELIQAARVLNNVVKTIFDDIRLWSAVWVNGSVETRQSSVLRRVEDLQGQLVQQREEKKLIPVHLYLTDEDYENQLYQKLSYEKFNHMLSRFRWSFSGNSKQNSLELELDGFSLPKETKIENLVERNYQHLADAVRPYFMDLKRENIASRLEKKYSPDVLADDMLRLSAPMLNVRREDESAVEQEVKTFISVDRGSAITYMNHTETNLQRKSNTKSDSQIIDAADPYRCVVISTQDLIGIDSVQSLSDARQAYDIQTDNQGQKRQLHIFPAEIHAIQYEKRLGEHPFYYFKKKPHQFSHRVVMLMEDLDRFELFMLAYALGIIQVEDSPDHRRLQHFILRLKRDQKFDQAFSIPLSAPAARASLFEALHTFVFKKPNKPGLDASLLIASVDGDLHVEKNRVEKAINRYEESIQWGLDYQVRPFTRFLRSQSFPEFMQPLLPVLESEFRYFLMEGTNINNKSTDKEKIASDAQKWLNNMRDLNIQYNQEIVDKAAELVFQARNLMQDSKDPNRLRRYLEENVILGKVPELINGKKVDERDLGILMHMIIWDYVQRLEQSNG